MQAPRYATGKGVPKKDGRRALSLMRRGCNLGSISSCTTLAKWFIEGEKSVGLRPDSRQGVEILEDACRQSKLGYACFDLAEYYRGGKRVKKSADKAAALTEAGCRFTPNARQCTQ